MNIFCTECGASLLAEDNFCTSCGAKILQEEDNQLANRIEPQVVKAQVNNISINSKNTVSVARQLIENTVLASPSSGEMVFNQTSPSMEKGLTSVIGPVKYLLGGVKRLFKGFKEVLTNKKKRIWVMVMAFIWLILSLLPLLGINPFPVKLLSFLTFSRGGAPTGMLDILGGTLGKGLFTYFITTLIMPVFTGKKPFMGMQNGMINLFGAFVVKDRKALSLLLVGVGSALIIYNFITGNASLQNSMVGIMAFVLSLRALSKKTGFLRGFILSAFNKFSKVKTPAIKDINLIIAGFTTGFALSVLLSATKIIVICYLIGIIFIVAAITLGFISSRDKEVAVR